MWIQLKFTIYVCSVGAWRGSFVLPFPRLKSVGIMYFFMLSLRSRAHAYIIFIILYEVDTICIREILIFSLQWSVLRGGITTSRQCKKKCLYLNKKRWGHEAAAPDVEMTNKSLFIQSRSRGGGCSLYRLSSVKSL